MFSMFNKAVSELFAFIYHTCHALSNIARVADSHSEKWLNETLKELESEYVEE